MIVSGLSGEPFDTDNKEKLSSIPKELCTWNDAAQDTARSHHLHYDYDPWPDVELMESKDGKHIGNQGGTHVRPTRSAPSVSSRTGSTLKADRSEKQTQPQMLASLARQSSSRMQPSLVPKQPSLQTRNVEQKGKTQASSQATQQGKQSVQKGRTLPTLTSQNTALSSRTHTTARKADNATEKSRLHVTSRIPSRLEHPQKSLATREHRQAVDERRLKAPLHTKPKALTERNVNVGRNNAPTTQGKKKIMNPALSDFENDALGKSIQAKLAATDTHEAEGFLL